MKRPWRGREKNGKSELTELRAQSLVKSIASFRSCVFSLGFNLGRLNGPMSIPNREAGARHGGWCRQSRERRVQLDPYRWLIGEMGHRSAGPGGVRFSERTEVDRPRCADGPSESGRPKSTCSVPIPHFGIGDLGLPRLGVGVEKLQDHAKSPVWSFASCPFAWRARGQPHFSVPRLAAGRRLIKSLTSKLIGLTGRNDISFDCQSFVNSISHCRRRDFGERSAFLILSSHRDPETHLANGS